MIILFIITLTFTINGIYNEFVLLQKGEKNENYY